MKFYLPYNTESKEYLTENGYLEKSFEEAVHCGVFSDIDNCESAISDILGDGDNVGDFEIREFELSEKPTKIYRNTWVVKEVE